MSAGAQTAQANSPKLTRELAGSFRPGAQITVVNSDDVAHTVTSKSKGQFDVKVGGNARATFAAPTKPGRYPYYCIYHPGMVGVLIVQ